VNDVSENIVFTEYIVFPCAFPTTVNNRFELGLLTEKDPVSAFRVPSVKVGAPTTVTTSLGVPSNIPIGSAEYDVIAKEE
jgi:hypothetical protein